MRFQASTVVRIKIIVACVRGPCSFVVGYGHFRGTLQLVPSSDSSQVTEAADSLKTLVIARLHGDITYTHTHTHTSFHIVLLYFYMFRSEEFVFKETLYAFLGTTLGILKVSVLR
jgi:hypothetical protein